MIISNESMDFNDPKELDNPQLFDDPSYSMIPSDSMILSYSVIPSYLIVYSIFALYRDTKTIHSIMMIWLVIFIISNYNLASGPPKDPGGVEKHIFKIKGH